MPVLSIPRPHAEAFARIIAAATWSILIGLFVWCIAVIGCSDATIDSQEYPKVSATSTLSSMIAPGSVPIWISVGPPAADASDPTKQFSEAMVVLDRAAPTTDSVRVYLTYDPAGPLVNPDPYVDVHATKRVARFRVEVNPNGLASPEGFFQVIVTAKTYTTPTGSNAAVVSGIGMNALLIPVP